MYHRPPRLRHQLEELHRLARGRERRLDDGIVHPPPFSAVHHQSGLAQDAQMMRDERLAQSSALHQIANAALAGNELLEHAQARFVAEGAESERCDGAGAGVDGWHPANILMFVGSATT